jgi:hypothetical protein
VNNERLGGQNVESHVKALQAEGNFRGEPRPLQPNPAEQQARERLGKPPPEKPVQDQGEPQRSKRKRTIPNRRKDPQMELLVKGLWAVATGKIYEGLSEEQIRLSRQAVNETFRMVEAGATPVEIRKMRDEYLLKKYPGLSLEEARKKSLERVRKILGDYNPPI